MANTPFQTTGISFDNLQSLTGNASDYKVGIFSSDNGELLFRDEFISNVLGLEAISLKDIYNRIHGVFYKDGQLYFKDETVSRPFSLKEIMSACQNWRKNLAAGTLWWVGRHSIDHSKCANITRPDDLKGPNVLWSIDKFLADITKTSQCDTAANFFNKSINEETGEWLWWDVQNLEVVVPPITDPYKVSVIMAKLAYVTCNSPEPIVFRLYDATSNRELTRTGIVQANSGKTSYPVTMNYFGPLTMSNKAKKTFKSGQDQFDCDSLGEDCGCNETNCIVGDPSCGIPNANVVTQNIADNSHLIKVQFHVVNVDNNYWNRVFGIVDELGQYYTQSNLDVVIFDTTLNSRFTKQHGNAIMNKETEYEVVFPTPLTTTEYSIQLSCSKNINCWWLNKKSTGFTIKTELPLTGQVDWSIVNISSNN